MITGQFRNKKIYQLVIWALLIISVLGLIYLAPNLMKPENISGDDFLHFWAAGYLNLHGKNPFDPTAIEKLRIQEGSNPALSVTPIVLNPPWVMAILMVFGLISFPISRMIWLLLYIIFILVSALILWRIYSGQPKRGWLALLAVFIFSPTTSVLEKGQLTVLILLGVVGFLYFVVTKPNDWLAGACLALVSMKPQIVILFWFALLLWILQQRRWLILISTAITVLVLCSISMIFNPQIFQQYITMLRSYSVSEWANPTIGAYLRFFVFGTDKFWIQFLPALLAAAWFLFYWLRHNRSWSWLQESPIILIVSLVTAPYAWTYDLVILVPAIIQATIWMAADWKQRSAWIFTAVFLAISIFNLYLHTKLEEFWFIWLAPAMLIWYLLIRWQYPKPPRPIRLSSFSDG